MKYNKINNSLQATAYVLRLVLHIMSLPFTGYWFYRRNCRINLLFCYDMCSHVVFRIIYALVFAVGISVFNLCYAALTGDLAATTLTLAVSMLFPWWSAGQPLLVEIRRSDHLLYGLMLLSLAAALTPHMFPFGVSLYLLLVAAVFYPSRRAVEHFQSYQSVKYYRRYPALLLAAYFD